MKLAAAFLSFGILAFAQEGRDTYRNAFQSWRTLDPTLERDAAIADATLGARADKVSAAAAKYFTEKKTYTDARSAAASQMAGSIEAVTVRSNTPEQEKNEDLYLRLQNSAVAASIGVFGKDPDRGIQQLRQMMERERSTLTALTDALKDSRAGAAAAADEAEQAEQKRATFVASIRSFAASLEQTADGATQQVTSWPAYYRALAESASVAGPTGTLTVSSAESSAESSAGSSEGPQTGAVPPGVGSPSSPVSATGPSDTAAARGVATVPLSRYVGAWTYTPPGSLFFGPEPEFVDMVVQEDKGEVTGTLYARFKPPAGSSGDPAIRFDFHGPLKPARNQSFPLVTSDNAMGTMELIPGPAFNLLEVNFKADPAPGKIRQANFILLKK